MLGRVGIRVEIFVRLKEVRTSRPLCTLAARKVLSREKYDVLRLTVDFSSRTTETTAPQVPSAEQTGRVAHFNVY